MAEEDVIHLIEQVSESLHNEIRQAADRIDASVSRHSILLRAGGRQLVAMERSIRDLETRLAAVERKLLDRGEAQ